MNAAHLHLATNHIPLIGALATLLLLMAGLIWRSRALLNAGLIGLVLVAIGAWVTAWYGAEAVVFTNGLPNIDTELLERHGFFGALSRNLALGVGALAIGLLIYFRREQRYPWWATASTLLANLALLLFLAWIAYLGGQATHPEIREYPIASEQIVAQATIDTESESQQDQPAKVAATGNEETEAREQSMNTYEEQLAFFQEQWPQLEASAATEGATGLIEAVNSHSDELERRVLFMFVRQGISNPEWQTGNLDMLISVADAGIAEFLNQAEQASDDETRDKRTDGANVISYNLAADLADCWPGDDAVREQHHFERGLKAANDCLAWREQLNKPPMPFSMAYWAKGMHELSLSQLADSQQSFQHSLDYAAQAAEAEGSPTDITPAAGFSVLLAEGYLGLASWASGEEAGRARYQAVIAAFTAQLTDEAKQSDAQFGIDQLQTVAKRYGPS